MPKLLKPPRRPLSATAAAPADPPFVKPPYRTEQRPVLSGVTWEHYVKLCDDPDHEGCKLTFDAATGRLEIEMAQGPLHESVSRMLFLFVAAYRREREIRLRSTGAVTLRRRDVGGLDPDESLYVTHVEEAPPLTPGYLDLNAERRASSA